jgi:hypothetical protein
MKSCNTIAYRIWNVDWTYKDTTGNMWEGGQNGKNPIPRHVQQ